MARESINRGIERCSIQIAKTVFGEVESYRAIDNWFAVAELTRRVHIKLNGRVSLRRGKDKIG
jgi:hypothetical protein